MVGGFLADRFGWIDLSMVALLAAAPLLAFSGGDLWLALPGLLLFQMTMPVTLVAMLRLMPGRPALAFGLPCLALIAGALPAYLPDVWRPRGLAVLALVLGSAALLFLALRRLVPPSPNAPGVADSSPLRRGSP
jgi:FSR family fosmidomycin resistance protein-like MFS transporter